MRLPLARGPPDPFTCIMFMQMDAHKLILTITCSSLIHATLILSVAYTPYIHAPMLILIHAPIPY